MKKPKPRRWIERMAVHVRHDHGHLEAIENDVGFTPYMLASVWQADRTKEGFITFLARMSVAREVAHVLRYGPRKPHYSVLALNISY